MVYELSERSKHPAAFYLFILLFRIRMDTSSDKNVLYSALRKAKSAEAMSRLLGVEKRQLELLALHPKYRVFEVPKNDTEHRLIEDPGPPLKAVQAKLNRYLQCAYYFEKSFANYGFVANAVNDDDKRNILANARKHLKRPWMIQTDLHDFFHYVTAQKVLAIFSGAPFFYKEDLAEILTALTTYNGRLPMGAPTSPVLSNFSCQALDDRLIGLANAKLWEYTRYVDDLTFSAKRPFDPDALSEIRHIVENEGFKLNDNKTTSLGPDDEKVVTGILLRGQGELTPGFLTEVESDIERVKNVVSTQNYFGEIRTHWVEKLKQQVRGKSLLPDSCSAFAMQSIYE